MPDTSANGTHRKCPAKVIEDYPWTISLCQSLVPEVEAPMKCSPWVSCVVSMGHGAAFAVVVEGKNLAMAMQGPHVYPDA